MEFDIINEIMTITVADLFQPGIKPQTPPISHPKYASSLSGPNSSKSQSTVSASMNSIKTENIHNLSIPTLEVKKNQSDPSRQVLKGDSASRSIDLVQSLQKDNEHPASGQRSIATSFDKESNNLSVLTKSRDPFNSASAEMVLESPFLSQDALQKKNVPKTTETPTVEKWIKKDGPQKLRESLNKLNLNGANIGKISLSGLTAKQLDSEKKKVKQELKVYDAAFVECFKRMPNREEKEPMRPLYIHYKRLKQYLSKAEGAEKLEQDDKGHDAEGGKGPSFTNISLDFEKNSKSISSKSKDGNRENKTSGSFSTASGRRLDNSFEENLLKDPSSRRSMNLVEPREVQDVRKYDRNMSKEEIHNRLEALEVAKTQIREKLHAYQVDFTKNNNRKIKYHKDIIPVEEDYRKYKEIKEEIQSFESMLKA